MDDQLAPSMPMALLLAGLIVNLILAVLFLRTKFPLYEAFLVAAISARLQSNLFHDLTLGSGGLSINAMITMAFTLTGMVLFRWASVTRIRLLAIENFIFFSWVATLIAGRVNALTDYVPRTIYLLVLTQAFYVVASRRGRERLVDLVLVCVAPLFLMQILSVVGGYAKETELDGSQAFIGGYIHEAAFSSVGLFLLCMALFTDSIRKATAIMVLSLVSIVLGSYRTALVAALPVLGYFYIRVEASVLKTPMGRLTLRAVAITLALFVGFVLTMVSTEGRFHDIGDLLTNPGRFFKYPWEFTTEDRQVMSGRLLLWSNYVYEYMQGNAVSLIFGNGADAWRLVFEKYAHNVYVSYLYEFGLVGALFYLSILVAQVVSGFAAAPRGEHPRAPWAILTVLVYGLGTIPLGNIEGIFLVAASQALFLLEREPRVPRTAPIPAT